MLVDDAPAAPELDGLEVLATGPGGLERLLRCEVVVKSPGISRYRPEVAQLEEAGVAVCGGLGLWMVEADPSRVACITGTKGKSTTTALAVHLLPRSATRPGPAATSATRPGTRRRTAARLLGGRDLELPGPRPRPRSAPRRRHVAVPRSPRLARIGRALLRRQALPVHQARCRARAGERRRRGAAPQRGALGPRVRWVGDAEGERDPRWAQSPGLRGQHNAANAAMARAVLEGLGLPAASDDARLAAAAGASTACRAAVTRSAVSTASSSSTTASRRTCSRRGPPSRPSPVAPSRSSWGGTTAASTTRRWAARWRSGTAPTLVVTMPDNGPRIGEAVRDAGGRHGSKCVDATSLAAAVTTAFEWAPAGGVVLLSPAAPSFGRFADYRERAAAFAEAAARCGALG